MLRNPYNQYAILYMYNNTYCDVAEACMNNVPKVSIMLGNGFNIALKDSSVELEIHMDYKSISDKIIQKIRSEPVVNERLIKLIGSCSDDLEFLLYILDFSEQTINIIDNVYVNKNEYALQIKSDREKLKKLIINTILTDEFHPNYQQIFANQNIIEKRSKNLMVFDRIYTTNYDLILYWILAHENLLWEERDGVEKGKFRDGFSLHSDFDNPEKYKEVSPFLQQISTTNSKQNIFYLHGALHILNHDGLAYKIIRDKNKTFSLKKIRSQILKCIDDFNTLIVFEPSSRDKLNALYNNNYLLKSYDKIRTASGAFVVYGCKTQKDNGEFFDFHLWHKIINSHISELYIGCGDTELQEKANSLKEELMKNQLAQNKISIYAYSYKDVNIWESDDFYNKIKTYSKKAA